MSSPVVADVTYLENHLQDSLRDPEVRRTARRKHAHRQVFGAATAILNARTELSITELASRAGITPSAVSAHFPSMDAMFAELYLNRVYELPLIINPRAGAGARVGEQLRAVTLVLADEPLLASACARALLKDGDDAVAGVRARVAAEVHRRTAAALGMGAWPEVLDALETMFWGALLQVQTHVMSYHAMADRLDTMVSLILPDTD